MRTNEANVTATSARELRQIADAAWRAYREAATETTMTAAELSQLRRTAVKAHDRWVDAAADQLSGVRRVH